MSHKYYDIVIIGSGLAGLYSAYNIQEISPETSFVVLEKYKKQWIGGRTNNETFYGTEIVTGAGVGRKNKDKLLVKLLKHLNVPFKEFAFKPYYSKMINSVINVNSAVEMLKHVYDKKPNQKHITFKEFAKPILGDKQYNALLTCAGYTDYENEDAFAFSCIPIKLSSSYTTVSIGLIANKGTFRAPYFSAITLKRSEYNFAKGQ
jgi:hypothetical protein